MSDLKWWWRHYQLGARFFWAFGFDVAGVTSCLWLGLFHLWWFNDSDIFYAEGEVIPRKKWRPFFALNLD